MGNLTSFVNRRISLPIPVPTGRIPADKQTNKKQSENITSLADVINYTHAVEVSRNVRNGLVFCQLSAWKVGACSVSHFTDRPWWRHWMPAIENDVHLYCHSIKLDVCIDQLGLGRNRYRIGFRYHESSFCADCNRLVALSKRFPVTRLLWLLYRRPIRTKSSPITG